MRGLEKTEHSQCFATVIYAVHCIGCSRVKSDLDESNLRVADRKENEHWKNKAFALLQKSHIALYFK